MNIIDEWDLDTSGAFSAFPTSDQVLPSAGTLEEPSIEQASSSIQEQPIFAVETVERNIGRGRGSVVCVAAACDCVVVATSRAYVLRYDFSQSTAPVSELELSKSLDVVLHHVWLDPLAQHMLVLLEHGGQFETHYAHARWKKSRVLSRLKGLVITCTGWDFNSVTEASTGDVLLGSEAGTLHSLTVEEKDKKEKHVRQLYDLRSLSEPVTGICQQPVGERQLLVLLTTATRLYIFLGGPTLEALFGSYSADPSELINCIELASDIPFSSLSMYTPPGFMSRQRFAWTSGSGILIGKLTLDEYMGPNPRELDFISETHLLPWEFLGSWQGELPIDVVLTEYHILVLYPTRLYCLNAVSRQPAQEVTLSGRAAVSGMGYGMKNTPVGMTQDESAGAVYMYTGDDLLEVVVRDEGRDMWRVYLEQKDFHSAAVAARTQAQRDAIYVAEAEEAFELGEFETAGSLYGKVFSPSPTFEEIALKLVDTGNTEALKSYLLTKLEVLGSADGAQCTMVATWLTELMLDQINRALLEESGEEGASYLQLLADLQAFLERYVDVLDANVTVSLLSSYGRMEEVMQFAASRNDHETLLDYLMQKGECIRALGVLRRPSVSPELFYKFAPGLMAAAPRDTVDTWMTVQPPLEPRRLLPAVLRFGEVGTPESVRNEALRYITYCIDRLGSTDSAVHNLAVALFSQDEDETQLLSYLSRGRDPLGHPLYDPQYALRCVRERKRTKATVAMLCEVAMFEDAVQLALTSDMDLAISVANKPEDNSQLQRKMWLAIAKHIITEQYSTASLDNQEGPNVSQISEFLQECGGAITIEDILPLFPDFVQIDNFKDAICSALEEYNANIEHLKNEMEDATRIADALRRDMAALEQRTATLDLSECCASCQRPLHDLPPPAAGPSGGAMPKFFLFPTGNAFHGSCLCREVQHLVASAHKKRISSLMDRLAQLPEGLDFHGANGGAGDKATNLRGQLEVEVAAEDPFCGDLVVRNIDLPFIATNETEELRSWQI